MKKKTTKVQQVKLLCNWMNSALANGRALHDDAMNTVLHLMMGVAVDDYAYNSKQYKNEFPYIIQ